MNEQNMKLFFRALQIEHNLMPILKCAESAAVLHRCLPEEQSPRQAFHRDRGTEEIR